MTAEELQALAEGERRALSAFKRRIHVCTGTGCVSVRGVYVADALAAEIARRGLQETVLVKRVGCMGLCAAGPIVAVQPQGWLFREVAPEDAPALLELENPAPLPEKLIDTHIPFFYRQEKNVLRNAGVVDPERIEDYIAVDGYAALQRALTEMTPAEVIQEVTNSGLRGRGGGGYPTGVKWSTVAKAGSEIKYVICNADEGDPGAFMDRSVLESDPHMLLEGMAIAAYATGATRGYIYVRSEYAVAIGRLRTAIRQAERLNLLGQNVCNTSFNFKVDLRLGAGAFVCGEETSLINSIEGNRGVPRPRPPYPAQAGLWNMPTLVNNVETFANVPGIINEGSAWFRRSGSAASKGTKIFALSGQVRRTGLIEVPLGITLREIVFDIGGGPPEGRTFKAVQTGGPSGGCVPVEHLDTPVDFESLQELDAMMGSGGIIVLDDQTNMIDMTRYFMQFNMGESCGKCIPCRVGTVQLVHLLGKFQRGEGSADDLHKMEDLCDLLKHASLCGLGQTAPNPVISTLRHFREEFTAGMHAETPRGEANV